MGNHPPAGQGEQSICSHTPVYAVAPAAHNPWSDGTPMRLQGWCGQQASICSHASNAWPVVWKQCMLARPRVVNIRIRSQTKSATPSSCVSIHIGDHSASKQQANLKASSAIGDVHLSVKQQRYEGMISVEDAAHQLQYVLQLVFGSCFEQGRQLQRLEPARHKHNSRL